jgi:hypothetical protein
VSEEVTVEIDRRPYNIGVVYEEINKPRLFDSPLRNNLIHQIIQLLAAQLVQHWPAVVVLHIDLILLEVGDVERTVYEKDLLVFLLQYRTVNQFRHHLEGSVLETQQTHQQICQIHVKDLTLVLYFGSVVKEFGRADSEVEFKGIYDLFVLRAQESLEIL